MSVNGQVGLAQQGTESKYFKLTKTDLDAAVAQQKWAEQNLKNTSAYLKQAEDVYVELEVEKSQKNTPEHYKTQLAEATKLRDSEKEALHRVALVNNRSYELAIKQLWSPLNKELPAAKYKELVDKFNFDVAARNLEYEVQLNLLNKAETEV